MQSKQDINPASKASIWTRDLILLAVTVFFARFGQGLQSGVSTNFFVHELGLGGDKVLWLAGIREIPGLGLIFIAALVMRLPQPRRACLALFLMGIGYGIFVFVNSYTTLIAMSLVASVGFHNWMPLQSSLGMAIAGRAQSGRVLGRLNSVGALASIVGMLIIVFLTTSIGLRPFFAIGGISMVIAAFVVYQLPKETGGRMEKTPRIVIRKRYWLFYVLTFFEGSRTQVFHTFGAWVLVNTYGIDAQ